MLFVIESELLLPSFLNSFRIQRISKPVHMHVTFLLGFGLIARQGAQRNRPVRPCKKAWQPLTADQVAEHIYQKFAACV